MRTVTRVIVHCSATPDKGDLIGVKQIREWHLERGWSDVGYHFVIRRSGIVEPGRAENLVGAHTRGENADSLGVCLVGTRDFTKEQLESLKRLGALINRKYLLDESDWFCHYQFSNKDCPNIPVEALRLLIA